MVSSKVSYIYGLSSSDDISNIRYIGYSYNIYKRRISHLKEAKNINSYYRHRWINYVLKNNNDIVVHCLGCFPEEDIQNKEIECIKAFKQLGYKLTNGNDGGIGGKNPTEEVREKIRLSKLGNKWNIGRKASQEVIEKLRKAMKGKKFSEEHKEKIKLAKNKTTKYSPNYKIRTLDEQTICNIFSLFNKGTSTKTISNLLNIKLGTIGSVLHNKNNFKDIKIKYNLQKNRLENFKYKWSDETRTNNEKKNEENKKLKLENIRIKKQLKENDIKVKINKIFELYNSGLTEEKVGEILETNRKNINRILNKQVYSQYSINLNKR